ncbi:unnamed protein product, partial [Prorocentrum cordatum]
EVRPGRQEVDVAPGRDRGAVLATSQAASLRARCAAVGPRCGRVSQLQSNASRSRGRRQFICGPAGSLGLVACAVQWRSSQGRRVVSATPEVGTRRAELRGVLGRSFVLALRSKCSGALADQSMEYCVGFPSSLSLRTLAQRKLAEGESRASDKASACGAHSSRFGRVCCIHPPMLSWMTVRIGSLGKLSPLPSPPGFADRSLSLSSPSPPRGGFSAPCLAHSSTSLPVWSARCLLAFAAEGCSWPARARLPCATACFLQTGSLPALQGSNARG